MTTFEQYLTHLAATGEYAEIPTIDSGISKPVKIVQMTPLENTDGSGVKQYLLKTLDRQGGEYILKVGS